MKHYPVSDPAHIHWAQGGKYADIHFCAEDGTLVCVTMPTQIFVRLQQRMAHALAGRPTPPRSQSRKSAGSG
jgi:hypothetical protein